MGEKMPIAKPEAKKEIIEIDDPYEAIVAAADGKIVRFAKSHDYHTYYTFKPDGTVTIEEEDSETHQDKTSEHKLGSEKTSLEGDVNEMLRMIQTIKKVKKAIPHGVTLKHFGGLTGIAREMMNVHQVEAYLEEFPKKSPAEQEEFRRTMSDKSDRV